MPRIAKPPSPTTRLRDAYADNREAYGGTRHEKGFQVAVDSVIAHLGDVDIRTLTPKSAMHGGASSACASDHQHRSVFNTRLRNGRLANIS